MEPRDDAHTTLQIRGVIMSEPIALIYLDRPLSGGNAGHGAKLRTTDKQHDGTCVAMPNMWSESRQRQQMLRAKQLGSHNNTSIASSAQSSGYFPRPC